MAENYAEQRTQMVAAAQRLAESGVLSHSGHGNMSVRLPNAEQMLITSVSHLMHLAQAEIAIASFDGEALAGEITPGTREIIAMHAGVYRERPDISAVIHTHSPQATTFALAHVPLPVVYEAFLRFGITEDIPVTLWAPRGSAESVSHIVDQLKAHPGIPAVLLGNHGVLSFGKTPAAAAQVIIIMEEAAEMTLAARSLGGAQPFPAGALEQERAHMRRFGSI
ncbi:MAG: class II aldolase/adducin family protein [Caldilineaceae bacterium]